MRVAGGSRLNSRTRERPIRRVSVYLRRDAKKKISRVRFIGSGWYRSRRSSHVPCGNWWRIPSRSYLDREQYHGVLKQEAKQPATLQRALAPLRDKFQQPWLALPNERIHD